MRINRHGLGVKSCYWRAVCSLLFIFQIPSGIEDVFSNRRKILAEDWAACMLLRDVAFFQTCCPIYIVWLQVCWKDRWGLGVLFRKDQRGQSSWSLGTKESGWFPVWRRGIHHRFPWTCGSFRPHSNFWSTDVILIFLCSVFSHPLGSDSATPWPAAHQASLSLTISQNLSKFKSIASVMPSHPLKPLCPSALNLCQHQGLFHRVGHLYQMTKVLGIHHQSLQWVFRVDFP